MSRKNNYFENKRAGHSYLIIISNLKEVFTLLYCFRSFFLQQQLVLFAVRSVSVLLQKVIVQIPPERHFLVFEIQLKNLQIIIHAKELFLQVFYSLAVLVLAVLRVQMSQSYHVWLLVGIEP